MIATQAIGNPGLFQHRRMLDRSSSKRLMVVLLGIGSIGNDVDFDPPKYAVLRDWGRCCGGSLAVCWSYKAATFAVREGVFVL